jgi:type II restriction enzyme
LKLLADGRLYAADAALNRIEDIYYPVIKICRQEKNQNAKEYYYDTRIQVVDGANNSLLAELDTDIFIEKAEILLREIKTSKGTTFSVPDIERFMDVIRCTSIKAKSEDKRDITLVVHDLNTGLQPELGFSIKSKLGGPSTLFNANKTSNFVFEIKDITLTNDQIRMINAINSNSKVRDRLNAIQAAGGSFEFIGVEGGTFGLNLTLIDTALPIIVSHMILLYYNGQGNRVADLVSVLEKNNPYSFDISQDHPFYRYKIKRMLTDMALGMTSGEVWDGIYDATGGYIVVKEDGDVLCYHVYNRNEFQDYLLLNTKFDTPSSSRHDFGYIYENNNKLFIKLGLQIRF